MEIGLSRAMSYLLLERKSLSIAQKRCYVIYRLSVGPPCIIPMNSSRYTSTCARDVDCACGDRASQLLSDSCVSVASSYEVCGGLVSAKSSRWCGGVVRRVERVSSVMSLNVTVVAHNKAADSTYPTVIDRWNPNSCSSLGVCVFSRYPDQKGMPEL